MVVETEVLLDGPNGQWNSVDIPLTSFTAVNLAEVIQFKVAGNGKVVFDNWYFGGVAPDPEPEPELEAAPTPTAAADSVLSIFSDAYTDVVGTDFNPNWGQSTQVSTDGGELTYTSLNYQGTAFAAAQDVSGYGYLHVDYFATGSTDLGIFLVGGGEVEYLLTGANDQWNSVDIPLTAFDGVNLAEVIQLKVDGNGAVRLDNLYFGGVGADTTAPVITLTGEASVVVAGRCDVHGRRVPQQITGETVTASGSVDTSV